MIPKSQIRRIIDGRETTFVRFELKIIFIFSMQTQLIHNKHEVSFAKIGAKGKPYYAADHIFDRPFMSRLAELSYSRNISFLDMRVSIATGNNKQIHSSASYLSAGLSFFFMFFFHKFGQICHPASEKSSCYQSSRALRQKGGLLHSSWFVFMFCIV